MKNKNNNSEIAECNEDNSNNHTHSMSIQNKFFHYVWFPLEYLINHFKEGSLKGAVFTLVIWTLCSGTASLPYLALRNGIILSSLYIIFGAMITCFWGALLVSWADKIGKDKYEDMARHWYGRNIEIVTGIINLITLMGFLVTYIVYLKTLIPRILEMVLGIENVPNFLGEYQWNGELFWATVYFILILFPMSLPRKINTFRFASLFGVIWTIYLTLCFIFLFFFDKSIVPNVKKNLINASYINLTFSGFVNALPYVNFNYMYQVNIPIIYRELKHKTYSNMRNVLIYASIICAVLFILISSFGYLTLVGNQKGLEILYTKNDILEVEYDSLAFDIGVISVLFTIIIVGPLWVLPSKDTIEDLFFFEDGMNNKNNAIISFILCLGAYLFAIIFPEVGDVITVCGFTTYPLIGFILPWVFYLEIVEDKPLIKTILWWLVILFIASLSAITCYLFVFEKATGTDFFNFSS